MVQFVNLETHKFHKLQRGGDSSGSSEGGRHFLKKFSPPLFSFKEKDIEWKTFLRIDLECRSTLVEKGKIEGKERGENENNEAKGIKTKGTKGVRKRKKGKNGK